MLNQGTCKARLHKARHVLEVLTHRPSLAALLGMGGAHAEDLARGWRVYRAAEAAHHARAVKKSAMVEAVDRCAARFGAARVAQGRLTALARVIITEGADRERLGLRGRRAEALGAWRLQAEVFHNNLTQADRGLLLRVGVDEAELAAAKALLDGLAMDHATCIAAKAEAGSATARKTAAFADLAAFLSVVIGIARVLEPDMPDVIRLLEMKPDGRRRQPKPAGGGVDVVAGRGGDAGFAPAAGSVGDAGFAPAAGSVGDVDGARRGRGRRSKGRRGRQRRLRV